MFIRCGWDYQVAQCFHYNGIETSAETIDEGMSCLSEHAEITKSPPPFIVARPRDTNILEWHYIIRGPPDTPYTGGEFWGTVTFPSEYPFRPPAIVMFTPSGRFESGQKICTSMSDYHPDSWNPAWGVSSILTGLLSFMVSEEVATGAVRTSSLVRAEYAKKSHSYNVFTRNFGFLQGQSSSASFKTIFPEYSNPNQMVDLPNMGEVKKS
ncbi:ubiquitin-conjugating enzyme E2 J2 [Puccinia sorghi]|uniref:Ubiquitin-conjugating enzyme E2 J2 n=1 Tax=Puccinia sorghi TaxID=27349 RepID=A0A0L6US72_9BASI|nr:ubiquitin-conjugating enzyme E2 J2 [Puccinia sorghi]